MNSKRELLEARAYAAKRNGQLPSGGRLIAP
jgi:hypothetical protein